MSRNCQKLKVLIEVCEFLYGEKWKAPLAKVLGVGDSDIQYWAKGDGNAHKWVDKAIYKLFTDKLKKADVIKAKLPLDEAIITSPPV